jgi:predicted outer membrane repeat protein
MFSFTKSRLSEKILFFIFIFILLSSFLPATILNVPGTFPTIQAGINAAVDSDTVLVQPGTYFENIDFGGKLIKVASLFLTTQDPAYISSTIIDGGNLAGVVFFVNGENSSAVLSGFTITNGDAHLMNLEGGGIHCYYASPSLDNLIITGNSAEEKGGGIYCYFSSSSLINVTISGNSSYQGGGIYCEESDLILQNVTITGNSASNSGSGIYSCYASYLGIINSILWDEFYLHYAFPPIITYSDIQGGWAGTGNIDEDPLFVDPAIGDYSLQPISPCIDAGDPTSPLDPDGTIADMGAYYFHQHSGPIWHISTTGSDITGNGSEQFPFATIQFGINYSSDTDTVLVHPGTYIENLDFDGKLITVGSLFLTSQDTTYISSTIIDGNSNGSVVVFGSGENSSSVLCGFTITNGSGSNFGGGIYLYASSPVLKNLIITGNSALYEGGGICCSDNANAIIQDVTIANNSTDYYGGGILCNMSDPSLENVTISGNTAVNAGGGIFCYTNSNPSLVNCILWDDSPEEISFYGDLDPNSITIAYSDIEGGEAGIVTNNNGTVNWLDGNIDADPLFVDPGSGDYHLQSTSPCIDAGDPTSPLDPDGTIADMGAYYYDQGSDVDDNELQNIKFNLSNYPNPFNPNTTIRFDIKEYETGELSIFNIKGQLIESHQFESGKHNYLWDASEQSSGIYLYKLQTECITETKKMILLK